MKPFQPTPSMIQTANLLLIAMAYHDMIKPTVEAYQEKVLAEYQFRVAAHWVALGEEDIVILDDKLNYLLTDEDSAVLFDRYDQERTKAGFVLEKAGDCPLLMAKWAISQAKHLLIDEMFPVTAVTVDLLLCQPKGLEKYEEYINLTLMLLTPFCTPLSLVSKMATPT